MNSNFLFIWTDSGLSTKSNHVNAPYHFVHIGEIMDYIEKELNQDIDLLDIEAEATEFQDIMKKIIKGNYKAVAFYINTENLENTSMARDKKIVQPKKTIIPSPFCTLIACTGIEESNFIMSSKNPIIKSAIEFARLYENVKYPVYAPALLCPV